MFHHIHVSFKFRELGAAASNQCTEINTAGIWFQIQTTPHTEGDLPTSPTVGKNGAPTHQPIQVATSGDKLEQQNYRPH
jgi:hypothetical protein